MVAKLIRNVVSNFKLDLKGIHGTAHWRRVHLNGQILCDHIPEADRTVVALFALFHDSQRVLDSGDLYHGMRAASFILEAHREKQLNLPITCHQLCLLVMACNGHTLMNNHDDITIKVCFDSDRLDIGRCKPYIDPSFLCTDVAKSESVLYPALLRSRS